MHACAPTETVLAVNPATMIVKECINLCSAMNKQSRDKSQTSVAALRGARSQYSSQSDSFVDSFHNLPTSTYHDPLYIWFSTAAAKN